MKPFRASDISIALPSGVALGAAGGTPAGQPPRRRRYFHALTARRLTRKASLLVCFCLTTFAVAKSPPRPVPPTLVFTNVNVVNTRDGGIEPGVTVVITKNQIVGVGKVGFVPEGRGIQIINANGKYLIPGLWDMHVHSAFVSPSWDEKVIYALYIANGVTGVRDMGGDPDVLERRRKRIESGELLGPHMVLGGPFLAGGKSDQQTIAVKTPEEARRAVDTVKSRGLDFVKILSNIPRESYFAIAEESAKQKIPFVGHVPYSVSVREAVGAGQRSIEHLTGILLACSSREEELRAQELTALASHDYAAYGKLGTQVMATYDPEKAQALFFQIAHNNTWQVPTLVWTQTGSQIDDPNLETDPRLRYVPATVRTQWNPAKLREQTSPEELAGLKAEAARDVELVKAMHGAGALFMAGTDGPDPFVFPGFSLHDELEWLVKSGFTPLQALQAATSDPARFLAMQDKYGIAEAGHTADLVLLDANPLHDIGNTRKIFAVVVGGKYYSRDSLDKMLQQVETLAGQE
jgi:imidazolonepropionase-like amidohydrolase